MPCFAQITFPLPVDKVYHYSIPDSLLNKIEVGSVVLVPFGKRQITGYVLGLSDSSDVKEPKDIISLLIPHRAFPSSALDFYRSIASKYFAPLGEIIKMALPPGLYSKTELYVRLGPNRDLGILNGKEIKLLDDLGKKRKARLEQVKRSSGLTLNDIKKLRKSRHVDIFTMLSETKTESRLTKFVKVMNGNLENVENLRSVKDKSLLEHLLKNPKPLKVNELSSVVRGASVSLNRLEEKGLVETFHVEEERSPFLDSYVNRDVPPELFEDQARAVDEAGKFVERGTHRTFLLHGVTGSGKTEVYLQLISRVLRKGKNALALVPEISLTPQFIERFRARFGDIISVVHSSLSIGERFDQWKKILRGETRIVIGARSALLAPLDNLGIIVVDEEHDPSYKQEERIMYNARDLAVERPSAPQASRAPKW